jgi:hypothetical protein
MLNMPLPRAFRARCPASSCVDRAGSGFLPSLMLVRGMPQAWRAAAHVLRPRVPEHTPSLEQFLPVPPR